MKRAPSRGSKKNPLLKFIKDEWLSLCLGLVLVFGMQLLEFHGWLAAPEGKLLDMYLRLGNGSSELAPIVTVEIDDAAYESCFHGSPMDPGTIGKMLDSLIGGPGESHPAVVGVDILTDSNLSYEPLRELTKSKADFTKIVWTSPAHRAAPYAPTFFEWLHGGEDELTIEPGKILGYEPKEAEESHVRWAIPVFPNDDDFRLRRFPRRVQDASVKEERSTWAATIASLYHRVDIGEHIPDVILPFGAKLRKQYAVGELFKCSKTENAATVTPNDGLKEYRMILGERDMAVLLGGTFEAARDDYQTPNGPEPGLLINARAIEAERVGTGIREAPRVVLIGLDLIVSIAIVAAFYQGQQIRKMIHRTLPVVPAALFLSWSAYELGYIWMSVIGVAFGFMPHLLMEIYRKNPKAPAHHHKM